MSSMKSQSGTSLVVQWLRIRLPVPGTWVWSLVRELRSHMPQGNYWAHPLWSPRHNKREAHELQQKILHAATKTHGRQINKYINIKKEIKSWSMFICVCTRVMILSFLKMSLECSTEISNRSTWQSQVNCLYQSTPRGWFKYKHIFSWLSEVDPN